MKFGVLGDIHSNLEALTVVLKHLEKEKVDKIFCLGDIVGYNANPSECVDMLIEKDVVCISGNHDRFVSGEIDAVIRPETKHVIEHTRKVLRKDQLDFISDLSDERYWQDIFLFVHGSPRHKDEYINSLQAARNSLNALRKERPFVSICFYGHTHLPYVISSKSIDTDFHQERTLALDKRFTYLVNPGSVGQPRDQCSLSSCIIFDIDKHELKYYRLKYDISSTQQKIKSIGFDPKLAERLAKGR
ncbi:MAG: metallophosphoesterase family protein [Candidatus Brocadiae bacterium]|nr:metallophosphoesterase family protein [Candidatus Brocadiia bacterium]